MAKSSFWENYRFSLILLAGVVLGCLTGLIFGEKALILKPLGDIFLNLMFTIVVPMVFVSLASAVGSMASMTRLGKILGTLLFVFLGTGITAALVVLVVVNVFPPAAGTSITLSAADIQAAPTMAQLLVNSLTVNDFSGLLSRKNVLPIIVFSIMFGLAVSMCGGDESYIGKLLIGLNHVVMKIVKLIMYYAPIGLGAYFASMIGEFGPGLIGDYGRVLSIYYLLGTVYFFTAWPLFAYLSAGAEGVRRMFLHIFNPALTAFATQSSVASLPANMEACKKIGVPHDIYNIVLPVGITMHMDGSVISAIVKISFLFGIFGIPFSGVDTYMMTLLVALLSAFVLSGAPGGGLVGEMLIVSLFGFPQEAFLLIATIGFLVDPMATCLNSTGGTTASMLISRIVEGKDWYKKEPEVDSSDGSAPSTA